MSGKNKKQLPQSLINKIKKERENDLKIQEKIKEQERLIKEEALKKEEEERLREQLLKEKAERKKIRLRENKKKKKIEEKQEKNKAIIARLEMNKTNDKNIILNVSPILISQNTDKELRSPICCVLGHVDTGKTSLLDKIRNSTVQLREFGGITQQIGVTYIPQNIFNKDKEELLVPGLLIMDTPGHSAFMNMRSRGSSICDIAILVVDITHGIEPQTDECLSLLKTNKIPFIVALNKVDLINGNEGLKYKIQEISTAFAERGFNAFLASTNPDTKRNVSLVPVSAKSGAGIPDLLYFIASLTQRLLKRQLTIGYSSEDFKCLVMEIKNIIGLGKVLDVILINGTLSVKDNVVVYGKNGPVFTKIKSIFSPPLLTEMRTTNNYDMVTNVTASRGIRITLKHNINVIPGTNIYKYTELACNCRTSK